MTIWFTSDTHFGHRNILKHNSETRPYDDVDQMNESMISAWNDRVSKNDVIYHLGDFALTNKTKAQEILGRLNGQKHLIMGNHDKGVANKIIGWSSIQAYKEISIDKRKIVLFHYAMRVWNCSHHGAFHLYGHSHGSLPDILSSRSMDVGVDATGQIAVSYEEVRERLEKRQTTAVDHHNSTTN